MLTHNPHRYHQNYDWLLDAKIAASCTHLGFGSTGPPSLLKVLAAGSNNGDALFKFTPAQQTDGIAAAAAGGLEGLHLITRRDRYCKSASQPSNGQVQAFPLLRRRHCDTRYHQNIHSSSCTGPGSQQSGPVAPVIITMKICHHKLGLIVSKQGL